MSENFNENDEIQNSGASFKPVIPSNLNATNQNFTNQISMSIVKSISGWGMFRAILDIISGGFSCLGGIMFLFISVIIFVSGNSSNSSFNFNGSFGNMSSSAYKIIGIIFLLCALIYPAIGVFRIIYSVNLIKSIDNLKKAIALNNESCIIEFFNKLNKFFKFNGITSILKLSFYILVFILYIILIIYAATAVNNGNIMNDLNNSKNYFP